LTAEQVTTGNYVYDPNFLVGAELDYAEDLDGSTHVVAPIQPIGPITNNGNSDPNSGGELSPEGCLEFDRGTSGTSLTAVNNCSFRVKYAYCLDGMPSFSSQFECGPFTTLEHRGTTYRRYNRAGSGIGLSPGGRSLMVTSVNTGGRSPGIQFVACAAPENGPSPSPILTAIDPARGVCLTF